MDSSFSSFYCPSSSVSPPAPSLPLPPLSPLEIKYDVFLSFRGEDTRYNFITHLHKALNERGINTFIDYNLNRGDDISPALLTAIEESWISIIIFSKEYASSTWCLQELMKILECKNRETNKQIVIPVFYGVTPSDLRNIRTGSFADAFAKHEKRFKKNLEQVHRWKDALGEVANLSGWPSSSDKSEAELIEVIVEDVCQKLDCLFSPETSNLVGIDSKIREIESLLCMGTNDVRSVGIWGMGGVGKTTLAEAVFNKISHQFKGCSYFASNVREQCEQCNGLNRLRQELLSKLLQDKHANINVHATGRTFMKNRFGRKKILIVFDDVSDFRQIEGLIGGFDCLGPQSRIIITTRDKQVLENCEVNEVYEVQELLYHEGIELFHRYAFRRNHPIEDYKRLSKRVVEYARGIPLALKVLGSHLYKKNIEVWESQIEKMGRKLDMDIYEVLKISYDGLEEEVKEIFLDIACFFKWSDIEHVKSILNACDFHTEAGIDVLFDKSLIAVYDDRITMHDLLEEMAKEIVRRESKDPGKRSRLWDHKEIYHVLTTNTATKTIEGIALEMSKIGDNILLNPCDFEKMSKLRILKFYDWSFEGMNKVHVYQGVEYNFTALRYLSWHGCPINSSLSSLSLKNLVILNLRESKVEQLWNGVLPLAKLKEVDLCYSHLTSCPDFSGSPKLKKLDLYDCKYLHEISPSIGRLNELEFLHLLGCTSLKTIPDLSGLISLRDLNLHGCSNLIMVDEMPCNLETFSLSSSVIEELPSSFGNLSRLRSLDLSSCGRLKRLPSRICGLKSLGTLTLDDCSELDQLPDDIGCLNSLDHIHALGTRIRELPSSIIHMKLRVLESTGFHVYDLTRDPRMADERDDSMADDSDDSMADDSSDVYDYDRARRFLSPVPSSGIIRLNRSDSDSMADENEFLEHYGCVVQVFFILSKCMMVKSLPKLQLEGRCADNLTGVEVLSSLSFQDCTPESDFEDIVKNALHARQTIKMKKAHVVLWYPGREVPKWFNFRNKGYFINLSSKWLKKNFMGFALCVAATPPQDDQGYRREEFVHWTCKVIAKDGRSFRCRGLFSVCSNYVSVKFPVLPFSPHIFCDAKEVSFEFTTGNYGQKFKIAMCGVHLMYGQYVEEVGESSRVREAQNNLSLAIANDNSEEIDEPHHKRLKKTPN